MPLHIDIRVNETLLNTLHIARVKGGTKPNNINEYLIVDGPRPTRHEDWLIEGIPFTHRYGDGAEVCVMKGIHAMQGNPFVTNANVTERLQIIDYLLGRIEDFEACTKDDSCKDIMYVLEGIVKDIEYGEHLEQVD